MYLQDTCDEVENVKLPNSTWKMETPLAKESSKTSIRYYYQLVDGNPLLCQKMATVDFTKRKSSTQSLVKN